MRSFTLVASLLAVAALGETKGAGRLTVGAGYDTNAARDLDAEGARGDLVSSLIGTAQGLWQGERALAEASYDLGARKFLSFWQEDTLVQALSAEASIALGQSAGAGVDARVKDRRGGDRAYSDLAGFGFLELIPDQRIDLRVRAGGHRFIYWPSFGYSFRATEFGAFGRYRLDRRHAISVFGDSSARVHNMDARPNPSVAEPGPVRTREDLVFTAGAGYAYRGPFTLGVAYAFSEQASNSFGESQTRHRITLTGGSRFLEKITVLGQVAVQLTRYPDGVFLSPEIALLEDEESHNSVSVKAAYELTERLDVEGRYALYQNRLPGNDLAYLRQLFSVGLTLRL